MNKSIGILYFSLTPEHEATRKQWSQSSRVNTTIAKILHNNALSKVKSSGLAWISSLEVHKPEYSFAQNLSHAIANAFDSGFSDLIIIGNDCIELTSNDIRSAATYLRKGQQTIGLDKSGGTYLFTLSASHWEQHSFEELPWCEHQLGTTLLNYLEATSFVHQLQLKSDLNTASQLAPLTQDLTLAIARLIASLLQILQGYQLRRFARFENISTYFKLRGPPLLR